jgi:hypothetical protein
LDKMRVKSSTLEKNIAKSSFNDLPDWYIICIFQNIFLGFTLYFVTAHYNILLYIIK